MFFLLGPKTCGCGCSGVPEGACRCSHSNTFLAEAYRTLSILKIIGVILVTFYELLWGGGGGGGSPGAPLGLSCGHPWLAWLSCGLSWALLGSPGGLGVSWGSPGTPFWGSGQGGWEGSFLIAICFKSDLKPVLVTLGPFGSFGSGTAGWHSKFALSEFCISRPLLELEIRIPAGILQGLEIRIPAAVQILHFKAGTRNSHSRCGSVVNSAFQAFAGTRNSHSRCGSVVNSAFQASCWHSKFAFPLRIPQ